MFSWLRQHLKPLGYKLLFATSGKKAIALLEENSIDLVLLDVMMPEMNGFQTCAAIKSNPEFEKIPVIFLTARNEVSDIVKGFDAGGADYITKPFHSQELIERVKTHVDLKKHRDQLFKRKEQLQELLHILSHDLRNSLSGITMTLDLADVEGTPLDHYEKRIREMSLNGLNIIDLVRTMLSLEEKPLKLQTVELSDAIQHSLQILKPQLDKKKITVNLNMKRNYSVKAEPTSLVNSVINNILTNAVKFSYENSCLDLTVKKNGPPGRAPSERLRYRNT